MDSSRSVSRYSRALMSLNFQLRPALVAYITCGDPDLATSRDITLAAIDAGADVIELGVPFSDPVADGPVIQRASERALRHGTSLTQVLELAKEVRKKSKCWADYFYLSESRHADGNGAVQRRRAHAGVDGALLTDLPVEESHDYLSEMEKRGSGYRFPGSSDQQRPTAEKDRAGIERICLRRFANRRDRHSPTVA